MELNNKFKAVLWVRHCQACHNLFSGAYDRFIKVKEAQNSLCTGYGKSESEYWGQNLSSYLSQLLNDLNRQDELNISKSIDLDKVLNEDYFKENPNESSTAETSITSELEGGNPASVKNWLINTLEGKEVSLSSSILPRAMETAKIISKGINDSDDSIKIKSNLINRLDWIEEKMDFLSKSKLKLDRVPENNMICKYVFCIKTFHPDQNIRDKFNNLYQTWGCKVSSDFQCNYNDFSINSDVLTANFISKKTSNLEAQKFNNKYPSPNYATLSPEIYPLNNGLSKQQLAIKLEKAFTKAMFKTYNPKELDDLDSLELKIKYYRFLDETLSLPIFPNDNINIIVSHSAFIRTNLDFKTLSDESFNDVTNLSKDEYSKRKLIDKAMKLNNLDAYLCIYEKQDDGSFSELRDERRLLLSRLSTNPVVDSVKEAAPKFMSTDIKEKPGIFGSKSNVKKYTLKQQRTQNQIENGGWLINGNSIVKGVDFKSKYSGSIPDLEFEGIPIRPDKFDSNYISKFESEKANCQSSQGGTKKKYKRKSKKNYKKYNKKSKKNKKTKKSKKNKSKKKVI